MLIGRSAAYSRSSTRRGARHCGPGSSPTGPRPVNQAPRPCSRCALVSRSATTSVARTVHSSSLSVPSESPGNLLGSRLAGLESDRRRDLAQPRRPVALLGARLHDLAAASWVVLDLVDPSDIPGDRAGDRRRPRQGAAQLHGRRCPVRLLRVIASADQNSATRAATIGVSGPNSPPGSNSAGSFQPSGTATASPRPARIAAYSDLARCRPRLSMAAVVPPAGGAATTAPAGPRRRARYRTPRARRGRRAGRGGSGR